MIEILNSKRMTILIVALILACAVVIIIEEWFTNNQLTVTSDLSVKEVTRSPTPVKFANNLSINVDLINIKELSSPERTNWREFLSFLSLSSFFGSVSGILVKYRQKQLRRKSLARFREPINQDESCHALIDMTDH